MAKISTNNHDSKLHDGVTFRTFPKTYGRRLTLDRNLAKYNQQMREMEERRTVLLEEARAKAIEKLGGAKAAPKSESIISISMPKPDADGAQNQSKIVVDQTDPSTSPHFQAEMLKSLDWKQISEINEKTQSVRLDQLRPLYMAVYLHSVDGLNIGEGDEAIPCRYSHKMSDADKQTFYYDAPADLIDEIFSVLADEIEMNEVERANFELPTTGGGAGVAGKAAQTMPEATTVKSVDAGSSIAPASADSRT